MKRLYLLAPAALLGLAGCSTYVEHVPVSSAYVTPAVVATAPAPIYYGTLADSDRDGVPDIYDRHPFDARWR